MRNTPNSFHNAIDPFQLARENASWGDGPDYDDAYWECGREPYGDEDVVVPLRRMSPVVEFLHRLRPGGRWMLVAIDADKGFIEARTLGSGAEVNAFVNKWNGKRNLYYSVNSLRGALNKKAEKEDVDEIEYLLSDFDPIGDESPEQAKQRYLAQLESFTPRPTMLMDSGNGLQGLWQLKPSIPLGVPIQLDTPIKVKGKSKPITRQFSPEDQAKVDDVEARSAALMRRLGAPTGTQNIDRILRLPGTINLPTKAKREKGRVPCETRLLWFEWSKYSLQDFSKEAPQEQQGGIPFMITRAMKATLRSAGYSDEQIAHMTPMQAHEIIRQSKGNGAAEEPFEQVARENKVYGRDESPSGYGYRFMRDRRREGMSFDEALAACLANEGKAGEWANRVDERQHERAYERWDLYDEKKKKPTGEGWPEPKPLPHGLAPVMAFDTNKFLPDALAPWVDDIATRLQCPPDYVGVSAITALGSLIGRRVGIKPQAKTDWIEYANLWAAFIGQPGMMKSPAMLAALAPLHYLENEAAKNNEVQLEAYAKNMSAYKLRKQVAAALEKDALKKSGKPAAIKFDLDDEPEQPKAIRYRTNDSTYEKLGELLSDNPNGLLVERDELCSLLQHLDREEQAPARSFFMTGWAGTHPYAFDRTIRGHIHIEAVCLSMLGNTQPTRISQYVCRANRDGGGGDGLIQRFGLLVWPDVSPQWHDVDQNPDSDARRMAWNVFERMSALDDEALRKLGASKGAYDKTYFFRFDQNARTEFVAWREQLERRLRSGELSPALEGHFAKYRKLVPALALINHLADGGKETVGRAALRKALAFSVYLESHAHRVYGAADMVELAAAEAILLHIKAGDLADGFTARDVHRHGWSNLTERDAVQAGLDLLVDCDYLAPTTSPPESQGGRPKITFAINPKGMRF